MSKPVFTSAHLFEACKDPANKELSDGALCDKLRELVRQKFNGFESIFLMPADVRLARCSISIGNLINPTNRGWGLLSR